ncbi:MAG: sulfite exporter TauE/SafE family protein [Chloroflexi bacterium HGW-Chloroflexi-9]|nr:MAG: sulfite exporter TauE/SafE family protein [Chloroflexi bacterium HGW-Chloroflexi-9]
MLPVTGERTPMDRQRAIFTGTVGGFVSGLTGIGGGTVMVPLLTGLLKLTQRRAHATSLVIVIFAALAAVSQYIIRGEVDWALAAALTVSSVVGAQIGAHVMHAMPDRELRLVFAIFLIVVGVRLLVFG